ncbi:MAG TPA: hypothetical protein EYN06_06180 [Myxococcales bacterium]|nr:hypothetical protein [Myxococcales bacterium]HIN86051.1 hypothetical protein [Myxococcales bacterium]
MTIACGSGGDGTTSPPDDTIEDSQSTSGDIEDVQTSEVGIQCTKDSFCDDGLYCNGQESCDPENTLANDLGCIAGPPPSIEDPNPNDCTIVGKCDEATNSLPFVVLKAGSPCDDGIPCTENDTCDVATTCSGTPNAKLCDDGLYCNGKELCKIKTGCGAGALPNAEDKNPHDCLIPHCVNELETHVMVFAPTGSACFDEWPCTIMDECTVNGQCKGQPQNELCSDDRWCNGKEICHPKSGCIPGTPPSPPLDDDPDDCLAAGPCNDLTKSFPVIPSTNCDDGVECTADKCTPGIGCIGTPNDDWCDDGLFCNGIEFCDSKEDCIAGTTIEVDDTVACTLDNCNEETQTVTHTAINSACDDGNFCNGTEQCHMVDGCTSGAAVSVNDGIACTVDLCDEITDTITHIATDDLCDDGLFCNGVETCNSAKGCEGATQLPVPPVDGNPLDCLIYGGCDELSNTFPLVSAPKGSPCENATPCSTKFECLPGGTCTCAVENCDDGVQCTLDTFDQAAGKCVHPFPPKGTQCDDGIICTLNDQCSTGGECAGSIKDCDDNNPCTSDTCSSVDGKCISTVVPNDAPCEDGDLTTSNEYCTDGVCGNGVKNCNDNNSCTIDSYNSETNACDYIDAPSQAISYNTEIENKQGETTLKCGQSIILNSVGAGCEMSSFGKLKAYSGSKYGAVVSEGCSTIVGTLFEGTTSCCLL